MTRCSHDKEGDGERNQPGVGPLWHVFEHDGAVGALPGMTSAPGPKAGASRKGSALSPLRAVVLLEFGEVIVVGAVYETC